MDEEARRVYPVWATLCTVHILAGAEFIRNQISHALTIGVAMKARRIGFRCCAK